MCISVDILVSPSVYFIIPSLSTVDSGMSPVQTASCEPLVPATTSELCTVDISIFNSSDISVLFVCGTVEDV